MIKTSKGNFEFQPCGGGIDYKVGCIGECCIGFFLTEEHGEREYFTTPEDIKEIWNYKTK